MRAEDILYFWYVEGPQSRWWRKSASFDALITRRFKGVYEQVVAGERASWRSSPRGRLAEIIVLDQLSRNMFRDTEKAFTADPLALALAQEAVRQGADKALSVNERYFLYMPFMHSESRGVHQTAMKLFDQKGLEEAFRFEKKHKEIIDRFGRYPHRNSLLGRVNTAEEAEFLKGPGSSF